ncbi:MAG TPA: IS110 family transposase [Acidimicrobiales bacterium]|nr:IS110 family transposase [Acidimicrobiales bacterium]
MEVAVERIWDRVAGLDVHRDWVVGCVRAVVKKERTVSKQKFATTSRGLAELAVWLVEADVSLVVMEATGVYWKPVYYALEGTGPELWLVNAHHVKNVPGRKTDLADAEWLADVAAHGMVRPSLVPPPPIRELRDLTRYRKTQVDERAREIQRLEKLLQAGIKLTSVASEVWSKSSLAMLEALIAGERDPAVLAQMSQSTMRAKIPALTEALAGRFKAHHAVVARQIIDHVAFLDRAITELSVEIAERAAPFAPALQLLCTIPWVKRTTAETFIAETGGDMSRFPTAGHLAAWAGLAPPITSRQASTVQPEAGKGAGGCVGLLSNRPGQRRGPRAHT